MKKKDKLVRVQVKSSYTYAANFYMKINFVYSYAHIWLKTSKNQSVSEK